LEIRKRHRNGQRGSITRKKKRKLNKKYFAVLGGEDVSPIKNPRGKRLRGKWEERF